LKTDLIKKYEDIRKNNETLFKGFEEKNKVMLKKQKKKFEIKIEQL
jgi:hypothetical protein